MVSKLAWIALVGDGQYEALFRPERHLPMLGPGLEFGDVFLRDFWSVRRGEIAIETVSPEGTFCDTVQVPSRGGDMELI